jgi:regulator of PEP synthase PpsR (kinase-PPPase family)
MVKKRKRSAPRKAPAEHRKATAISRKAPADPTPLYVLSDSTGNLARHMVTTFLTQFPPETFQVQLNPFVAEAGRWADVLETISGRRGVVMHAVVSQELKSKIASYCQRMEIPCCDMTGSLVDFLSVASRTEPICDQNRLHRVDRVYYDRINAMSFTLEHDDGLGLDSLGAADIVLAGISRTGKTPTSVYLAMQGYRVANVSLAIEAPVPPQLMNLSRGKTVGLVIDAAHLAEIRARRQTAWQMAHTPYCDPQHVEEEIEWSRRIFGELHCPVLDVTDQAIEETAARVLDLLGMTEPARRSEEGLS